MQLFFIIIKDTRNNKGKAYSEPRGAIVLYKKDIEPVVFQLKCLIILYEITNYLTYLIEFFFSDFNPVILLIILYSYITSKFKQILFKCLSIVVYR